MRSLLGITFLALIVLPGAGRAEVRVAPENRIRNLPGDRCGWCALETLARHHGIQALYGLADRHTTRATAADLEEALDDAHVNYRVQDAGCRYTLILRYATRAKLGAVVGFRERAPGDGGHLVTLVGFGPDTVRVIDSNDPDGRVRTMPLKRFLSWWDGFALVIEPEEVD
jgi:hypothetical protein